MNDCRLAALLCAALLSLGSGVGQSPQTDPLPRSDRKFWPAEYLPQPDTAPMPDAIRTVQALLDEHVEYLKRTNPIEASTRGDERFGDQLPDESPEGYAARRAELADRLARLERLPLDTLPEPLRTSAALLRYDLTMQLAGARFFREQMPISTMRGPHLWLPQLWERIPLRTPEHYADYAARLEKMPVLIAQTIEQMRAGLAAGRVPPRVTLAAAVEQCLMQATPQIEADPTRSPFYRPFLLRGIEDASAARARRAIATGIVPALRELARFLRDQYIPRCRDSIGAREGIDGMAAYEHALRHHTTLELSAGEIHRIGLEEVARIRAEMLDTIARTDFPRRGELAGDDLLRAFVEYLRTEPRFYYTRAEDLLNGYRIIAKRIDPELPRLFSVLPRNPYGVREIPEYAASSAPTAYYYAGSLRGGVPGYFMANTFRLDQRPTYSMIALTLHEAVPGHHLQIALAEELEHLHEYHRWVSFTAYIEGWALYAERLGLEMGDPPRGLYSDPYDDFGRLGFEMWRACRLVVDTGIHALGWTRDQAIEYLLAHTGLARHDAEREVDRYIGWPGQATAYKIGELTIRRLRTEAQTRLGDRFDLRAFHDAILGAGPLPLPILDARLRAWIDAHAP